MKKILSLVIVLIFLLSIVGCQTEKVEVDTPKESIVETIEFKRVSLEDLNEHIQILVKESKSEEGYKIFDDESGEHVYLAVFAGQKPSTGYGVEITKVEVSKETTKITVKQTAPPGDSDVATVLTYPMDIVKLQELTDDIELKYINPNTHVSNSAESALLETQIVIGEYVEQVDNNSIEVIVKGALQVLRLDGTSREQLSNLSLDQGDLVELEVFTNEHDQLTVYSMKIPRL